MNEHAPRNNPQYLDHHPNAIQDIEQARFMANASHELRSDIENKRESTSELRKLYPSYSNGGHTEDKVQATRKILVETANEINELRRQADGIEDEKALEYEPEQEANEDEAA
ncbi:MAG: hypothetical protein JWO61_263 [Candidatus Saccharibacteria bacterium]|nr:hypothetical protein [Candidatus Saccharibacteria bacterium]